MTWWNTHYPYRRALQITPPPDGASSGHPVFYSIDITKTVSLSKMRSDYADVEILYYFNNTWTVVGRVITNSVIEFPLQAALTSVDNTSYFIYYGNPNLVSPPTRPSYSSNTWPVSVLNSDSQVSYTQPGEEWVAGQAAEYQARATFPFYGSKVRLISDKDSIYSIAEAQVDNDDWSPVDLYSPTLTSATPVFLQENLTNSRHTLRVRVSGRKNPKSFGNAVNITRFEYMKYMNVIDLGEEITSLAWSSSLGGSS